MYYFNNCKKITKFILEFILTFAYNIFEVNKMNNEKLNLVPISEANQNFSKVAKLVEQDGDIIIIKNNKPVYVLSKYDENKIKLTDDDILELIARRIISEHINALKDLAQ